MRDGVGEVVVDREEGGFGRVVFVHYYTKYNDTHSSIEQSPLISDVTAPHITQLLEFRNLTAVARLCLK